MPLPKGTRFTSEDYWNLPEGRRAELIDGQLYDMAPPSRMHQKLISQFTLVLGQYIRDHHGTCEVYPAPFAVNLDAEDKDWVEPDISVICDTSKLDDRGCNGAPDLVVEVVSPSSRKMDYFRKNALYSESGVLEYWIVDPDRKRTTIYRYQHDDVPVIVPFAEEAHVGIFPGLAINIADLLK
mgnify:FL=1